MTKTAKAIGLACLSLPLLVSAAQADTLILPEIPGTGAIDITQPVLSNPEMSLKQGGMNLFRRRLFGRY